MRNQFSIELPAAVSARVRKFCKDSKVKRADLIRTAIVHGLPEAEKKLRELNPDLPEEPKV